MGHMNLLQSADTFNRIIYNLPCWIPEIIREACCPLPNICLLRSFFKLSFSECLYTAVHSVLYQQPCDETDFTIQFFSGEDDGLENLRDPLRGNTAHLSETVNPGLSPRGPGSSLWSYLPPSYWPTCVRTLSVAQRLIPVTLYSSACIHLSKAFSLPSLLVLNSWAHHPHASLCFPALETCCPSPWRPLWSWWTMG